MGAKTRTKSSDVSVMDLNNLHPTAVKLIDATLAMLESQPIEKIGIEKVLEVTKIARSSLYHHFDNFPHLIECAVAYRFVQETQTTIEHLRSVLDAATCKDTFKNAVLEMNKTLQAQSRSAIRMQRVVAFASTDKNQRFMNLLKNAQQNLTDEYAKILRSARSNNWVRPDIDPQACAVFVQAMTIGRIVDDVSEDQVMPDNWIDVSTKALTAILW